MVTVGDVLDSRFSFGAWMQEVDNEVFALCGVGVSDIADFTYRDYYDDGVSPRDTAMDALEFDSPGIFDDMFEDDF